MKFVFTLLSILAGGCLLIASSCTDNDAINDTSSRPIEPGVYYIAMNFYAEKATTKGVNNEDQVFDTNYDYDNIYLHKIGAKGEDDKPLELPVYECDGCDGRKGIRYRICKYEDGHAVITPIDQNGDHVETSITLDVDDECYFSSWLTNEWKLDDKQIEVDTEGNNHFFRNQENNKEIYCSENTYGIDELAADGDITIVRGCAGFSLVGMFYDASSAYEMPGDDDVYIYTLNEEKFTSILGDPGDWYIKIYIGGDSFSNQYDFSNQYNNAPITSSINGYYSSGDGVKFAQQNEDTQIYLPFSDKTYLSNKSMYGGYGYYTDSKNETGGNIGNYLFTPVTGEEVNVYIFIKHWTGSGLPTQDWLMSDEDALYTKVDISTDALQPKNGNFYTVGLLMDINQFKTIWEEKMGSLSATTSAISTKSPSGATVREFTLKDAKVICDVY